jgi:glycosyltransferase involved in cell wall biosynthesis
MDHPEVTVLMPVFNAERFLRAAIDSILYQTFTSFELIIINDGSTDRSVDIINSYRDPRIRTIVNAKNSGPVESRNAGLRIARGKYIAPLDADDVCEPQRLERQVSVFEANRKIALLATWGRVIDEYGNMIKEVRPPLNPFLLRWKLLLNNQLIHSSVMFPVSIVRELGGYKSLQPSEDYDLYSRIIMDHFVLVIPEHLVLWRKHSHGLSCKEVEIQKTAAHEIARRNSESLLKTKIPLEDIQGLRAILSLAPIPAFCDLKRNATLFHDLFHAAADRWKPDSEGYTAMAGDCSGWLAAMASIAAQSNRRTSLHILKKAIKLHNASFFHLRFWKAVSKIILGPFLVKIARKVSSSGG